MSKKQTKNMNRRLFCTAVAALGAPWLAHAQSYPERPIKILQGFAAGGNADTIARLLGIEIGKSLNQTVIVEAQTGAGGTIASAAVSRAKPDGHTLLLATGGHAVAGALYNTLPYQTVNSFEMVSTVTFFPFLIVTAADSKYRTLRDLLAAAKANPDTIGYGSAGIGSTHHLAGEVLAKMAGVELLHVPYRGDAASITAVLAGDIPVVIAPATAVLSNIKAGKLRALATSGGQRWPGLPEVLTAAEQGVTGYDVRSWAGLMAPAGTPRPIIDKLNAETLKVLMQPQIKARLEEIGGEARGSTPEEMKAMVTSELQRWTRVVNDAKIPKQ